MAKHSARVVIETTGEEVVDGAAALPRQSADNSAVLPRGLQPFADTLPRISLRPSPFAQSA
jgi:hypothetical protein